MAINGGSINGFGINAAAAAGPPPVPVFCASFDQSWAIAELAVLQASFDQAWAIAELSVENASFDQSWALTVTVFESFLFQLGLDVDFEGTFVLGLNTDLGFVIENTDIIEEAFAAVYDLKFSLQNDLIIEYNISDTDPVDAPFEMPMPLIVDAALGIEYNLRPVVQEDFVFPSRLLVDADAPFTVLYNIKNTESVDKQFSILYSLLDETSIDVTGGIELEIVATGEIIAILEGSVQFDEGGYNWVGRVSLANIGDESKFEFDTEVILRIFGEEYSMVVDSKDVNRDRPGSVTSSLTLAGISARLDVPRASAFTGNFDTDITASAAAEAILGTTVDWQMIDWVIPGGRLGAEAVSPIQFAQQIATAGGGVLESNKDGTVYVRDLFPVPVAQYPTTTPDHIFLEQDSIMSLAESFEGQEIFNKFRIRDVSDSDFRDRIVFEASDQTGLEGCLFVFPSPFRPITVEHTSDTQIGLTLVGEVFLEKEELIEFTDGQGNAGFPIFDLLSVEWMDDDLGALTFTQFENTFFSADPVNKFSLATVKYRTKAVKFTTSSTVDDQVQFLVVDC